MKIRGWISGAVFYVLVAGVFLSVTCLCSRATAVIAQMVPVERDHTIVIDAGHGGEDGGATSCTGILESRINLEIALKLNDLFRLLGYHTKMIRATDTSVYVHGSTIAQRKVSDLKERVRIVNETDNAILVSIHQNTFSDGRYSGAQIFCPDNLESRLLAEQLQTAICATINPSSNRKSKVSSGIYLLEHIACTGVLVESGFLSNPEEEAKLRNDDYQRKLCCVIVASVGNFLDQ